MCFQELNVASFNLIFAFSTLLCRSLKFSLQRFRSKSFSLFNFLLSWNIWVPYTPTNQEHRIVFRKSLSLMRKLKILKDPALLTLCTFHLITQGQWSEKSGKERSAEEVGKRVSQAPLIRTLSCFFATYPILLLLLQVKNYPSLCISISSTAAKYCWKSWTLLDIAIPSK